MNWVVYHIVSGHAFFSGVGLVIFAALVSLRSKGAANRTSGTAFLIGLIATDLDALLKFLAEDDRQIVMFELPLPPFYHHYGRAQRQLASKHHVRLVPKATLLNVIAGSDSTLDSIHLTQSGHQLMADCVWKLIKSALPAN